MSHTRDMTEHLQAALQAEELKQLRLKTALQELEIQRLKEENEHQKQLEKQNKEKPGARKRKALEMKLGEQEEIIKKLNDELEEKNILIEQKDEVIKELVEINSQSLEKDAQLKKDAMIKALSNQTLKILTQSRKKDEIIEERNNQLQDKDIELTNIKVKLQAHEQNVNAQRKKIVKLNNENTELKDKCRVLTFTIQTQSKETNTCSIKLFDSKATNESGGLEKKPAKRKLFPSPSRKG